MPAASRGTAGLPHAAAAARDARPPPFFACCRCCCRGAVGAAQDLALGTRPWERRGRDPPYVEFALKMVRRRPFFAVEERTKSECSPSIHKCLDLLSFPTTATYV